MTNTLFLTWGIAALSAVGVIVRPFRWPEAIWAALGAAALVILGLTTPSAALTGILKGVDVYLFLIGMMLISETARQEGLFDWLAAIATSWAKGSPKRLFGLVFGIGTLVTAFLSNDATAVVLTPAVYAATRAARVRDPLPYLFICAFIANAASFVLPISNPANLVIFGGGHMPPLAVWLGTFTLPSLAAIAVTYVALYLTQRRTLAADNVARDLESPHLSPAAKVAGWGLVLTAIVLVAASALNLELGPPTFAAGVAVMLLVVLINREAPFKMLREISWSVLPLVAGLFVIVEALAGTGLIGALADLLGKHSADAPLATAAAAGTLVAFGSNLVNNLPMGLVAASTVQMAHVAPTLSAAILIGVDLGPNLSVTGSLATILWLTALRREGLHVSGWQFLKLGTLVMIPALFAAFAALLLSAPA